MRRWTQQELDFLLKTYPTRSNSELCGLLHRSKSSIQLKAQKLGLAKTPKAYAKLRAEHQFKKGHTPFNKGKKQEFFMSPEGRESASRTQFKKGVCYETSPTYRPVGYESIRRDKHGIPYAWVKVDENKRMVMKHRWVWEQAHGPIPKGRVIMFVDGNTLNCAIENLRLLTRSEQCRQNQRKITDERRAEIIAKGNIKRKESIRADRLRLKYGLEPHGRLVKHYK